MYYLINVNNLFFFESELILFLGSLILLFYPLFVNKRFYNLDIDLFCITIIILVLCLFCILTHPNAYCTKIFFYNMIIVSYYTLFIKFSIIILSLLFFYIFQIFSLNINKTFILSEFYFLYIFSILICFLSISSFNLILLFVFLECLTYILYTISCSVGNLLSNIESVLKYFFIGSLSSLFYILGCVLIYGFGNGSLNFDLLVLHHSTIRIIPNIYILGIIFLFFSFIIKLGAFPFHFWVPDVYEGIWTPITFFFSIIIKLVFMSIFLNLLFFVFFNFKIILSNIFIVISIGSMIIGCLGTIYQETLKRFILYSSISQMGFIFAGISNYTFESLINIYIYLYIYIFNSIVFFFIIMILLNFQYGNLMKIKYLTDLSKFIEYDTFLFFFFSISLLSMGGFPPLSGFFGKYLILVECFKCNNNFLGIIFLLVSVITCYYYLKIVKICLYDSSYFEISSINFLFVDRSLFFMNLKDFPYDSFIFDDTNIFYYPFHIILLLLITLFNILFIFIFSKFYFIFYNLSYYCIGLYLF